MRTSRNIPLSAIEPFGVIGIPTINVSGGAIAKTLEAFFDTVVRTSKISGSSMYDNATIFCNVSEKLVLKLGAINSSVATYNKATDSHGALIAVSIRIKYVMPNKRVYTRRYRF